MTDREGKYLIQNEAFGGRGEIAFHWPNDRKLDPEHCRCKAPVFQIGSRAWDCAGARREGDTVYAKEHVCTGKMGSRAHTKRARSIQPLMFDNREVGETL